MISGSGWQTISGLSGFGRGPGAVNVSFSPFEGSRVSVVTRMDEPLSSPTCNDLFSGHCDVVVVAWNALHLNPNPTLLHRSYSYPKPSALVKISKA